MATQDGSRWRAVTAGDGMSVGSASLSPGGRSVMLDAVDAENRNDLFVTGIDSGPTIRLTQDDHEERNPDWSHDGAWIYYETNATGRPEIWASFPFQR